MLFLILLSTSLGVWATIDMLSSDEKSDSSDEETASEQLIADEELDSTDNFLQLGDKNNVVGYDASETENYADMRGDDTIIGGSEKDLIIDYSGSDSLMGGAGSDYIFTPDYDLDRYDGGDTVDGGNGNDLLWIDDGDNATGGTGIDAFVIEANIYDPNYEPIAITDFNRNEDTIEIGVFSWPLNAPIDQNRLDTELDFDARQTLIYVDDDVVAKLDGLFVGIDDRITLTHLNSLGQHSLDQVT
jgi:Ca2+-binding RTX toxin-like protein